MIHLISVETIRRIIELANICYPTGGPSRAMSVSDAIEEGVGNNPSQIELHTFIRSLEPEQLAELRTLMLLGRGANEEVVDDWADLYRESLMNEFILSAHYVGSNCLLSRYLQNGLIKLGLE